MKHLYAILILLVFQSTSKAQCPPNIDLEMGDFSNWQCWAGRHTFLDSGEDSVDLGISPVAPIAGRHTILKRSTPAALDFFGGFSKNSPNGSNYSIMLGDNIGANQAEAVSYTFTIPPGQNDYVFLYQYAVVFQDPAHGIFQQPRFDIRIENLTDGVTEDCSSLNFRANNNLQGFTLSSKKANNINVYFKDWATNSIHLKNKAGKTFRFFFITSDCTFIDHFCYAYIDIDKNCENNLEGGVYCKTDPFVNVSAPDGFEEYTWYNGNFSQVLSTSQVLNLTVAPANGTIFAVEVKPKNSYGCVDTLLTKFYDTLTVQARAGPNVISCNGLPVLIGTSASKGSLFSWMPNYNLENAMASITKAWPGIPTKYYLTVTSAGGGCKQIDSIVVSTKYVDTFLRINGKEKICFEPGINFPVLYVVPADSIQWFIDGNAITGSTNPVINVVKRGTYYAQIFDNACATSFKTSIKQIFIDTAVAGIAYSFVTTAINFPETLHARNFGTNAVWSPAISLTNAQSYNPIFKGANQQQYTIKITNNNGCITTDSLLVKTVKKIEIYVPTIFTPNGDSKNDFLKPLLLGFAKINYFKIYNRWGQLLFETKSDLIGWDGKINNIVQEMQSVVWMVEAVDVDGKIHQKTGTTILMH